MKHLTLCALLALTLLIGTDCKKGDQPCKPRTPLSEAGQIQAYATANGITATALPNGLYYQVIDPGTGANPTLLSKIYIRYVGKLLDANGTIFDQQANSAATGWVLNSLIEGWQIGIPLIKKGGRIILLVPSSQAYGCDDYYSIPGNSVLYFDVTLVDVQ